MRVVGLDLSLASTGVADIVLSRRPDARRPWGVQFERIQQPPAGKLLINRHRRMLLIEAAVCRALRSGLKPDLVVVEGPAMGAIQGAHDLSGNWHRIMRAVCLLDLPVMEVSPPSLKLYATGSGSARGVTKVTKTMVGQAVRDRYGIEVARLLDGNGSDVADAFILAAIGLRLLGHPIEPTELPEANMRALAKLHLPEGINPK